MRPQDAIDRHLKMPWDRLYMRFPEPLTEEIGQMAAEEALRVARAKMPRLSGVSAGRLFPIWGKDFFGIGWKDNYVWFQEMGIRPFVMRSLEGKTVPMWVEDTDGSLRRNDPNIKQKTAADGRTLVLIFRRAAKRGERKTVKRMVRGVEREVSVPRSYPGAPGRINRRGEGAPRGRKGGQIIVGNVGVRWRHPGLASRFFIHDGLLWASRTLDLGTGEILVAARGERI